MMDLDRFKHALAAFVRELFPTLDYMGFYEYLVVGFDTVGQTVDLQPVQNIGLPTLTKYQIRSPGINYTLADGTSVLVGFENRDPTRPYVAFFDKLAGSAYVPSFMGLAGATPLDAPPIGAPIARIGDTVGPFLITSGSPIVRSR